MNQRLLNNHQFPETSRKIRQLHPLLPSVYLMSFLRPGSPTNRLRFDGVERRLCENTFISPEGVEYSLGRSPGFFGLRNRSNILAPAHTFERERSKVWAGAFYEDVCLCRVPQDCVLGYIQRPPLRSGLPGYLGTFCSFSQS